MKLLPLPHGRGRPRLHRTLPGLASLSGRGTLRWLGFWGHCSRSLGEGFADQSQRYGRGQDGTILLWLNFQAVEKCFDIGIGSWCRDCAFGGAKKIEEASDPLGQLAGILVTASKCLSFEVDRSQIAHRGHDSGRFLK